MDVLKRLLFFIFISIGVSIIIYLLCGEVIDELIKNDKINLTNLISVSTSISAIVFAISGAWVALIFPEALKKLTSNNETKKITSNDEINAFTDTSLSSVFSLIILIFIIILNYLLSIKDVFSFNVSVFIFMALTAIYLIQIYILCLSSKVILKVFYSYSSDLVNKDTGKQLESQSRDDLKDK